MSMGGAGGMGTGGNIGNSHNNNQHSGNAGVCCDGTSCELGMMCQNCKCGTPGVAGKCCDGASCYYSANENQTECESCKCGSTTTANQMFGSNASIPTTQQTAPTTYTCRDNKNEFVDDVADCGDCFNFDSDDNANQWCYIKHDYNAGACILDTTKPGCMNKDTTTICRNETTYEWNETTGTMAYRITQNCVDELIYNYDPCAQYQPDGACVNLLEKMADMAKTNFENGHYCQQISTTNDKVCPNATAEEEKMNDAYDDRCSIEFEEGNNMWPKDWKALNSSCISTIGCRWYNGTNSLTHCKVGLCYNYTKFSPEDFGC
jgi:hypothetical protein